MSDEKKDQDVIELVAVERGFILGKLVEPGHKFMFRTKRPDGTLRKLPKWAQPADVPMPKKVERKNGDLKPLETQKAVAAKAGALSGASPAGVDSLV